MDDKMLELLKKISQVNKDIKQDKIDRLKEAEYAPYSEVGSEGKLLPKHERSFLSDTTLTPQGLSAGQLNAPKVQALFDRLKLQKEPNLNIEDFYSTMENIPENTSDPKIERFKKLFNK